MGDEQRPWDDPEIRAALRDGDWVPALRAAAESGLSQTVIAARAGISQAHVSRLATGRTRDPGIRTISALCSALDIPVFAAGLIDEAERGENTDRRGFLSATLGAAASVAVPTARSDDARQGLRLIRGAAARLPRTAPATARAWLAAADAVALAHLGDVAALRMLDDASRHAEAGQYDEPQWPWVFRFDQAKVDQARAVALSRLGRRPTVAPAESPRSPKQAAIAAVEHARALVACGEIDESCRVATGAYRVGVQYASERVRAAVRDFRSDIVVDTPNVRDLDELMFDTYEGQ